MNEQLPQTDRPAGTAVKGTVAATVHAAQLPGSRSAPPERTLLDILQETAAKYPDASALDDGRRSLSYAQLMAEVRVLTGVYEAALARRDAAEARLAANT